MYKIKYTKKFKRQIKKLSKKYISIKKDYANLLDDLEQGNLSGNEIQGFQGKIYKVRVASSNQQKGKSGWFRFIYYAVFKDNTIYMMTAYAKSIKIDLNNQECQEIKNFIISLQNWNT